MWAQAVSAGASSTMRLDLLLRLDRREADHRFLKEQQPTTSSGNTRLSAGFGIVVKRCPLGPIQLREFAWFFWDLWPFFENFVTGLWILSNPHKSSRQAGIPGLSDGCRSEGAEVSLETFVHLGGQRWHIQSDTRSAWEKMGFGLRDTPSKRHHWSDMQRNKMSVITPFHLRHFARVLLMFDCFQLHYSGIAAVLMDLQNTVIPCWSVMLFWNGIAIKGCWIKMSVMNKVE